MRSRSSRPCSFPAPDRRPGARRQGRLPDYRHGSVEELAADGGLEVVRTPAAPADLTAASPDPSVVFAGAVGGVLRLSGLPARSYDAVASLCKLLELLAPRPAALELVAELPSRRSTGSGLPVGAEGDGHARPDRAAEGRELDLTDGIKLSGRARLGAVLARSGRAADPPLRRGRDARRPPRSSKPSCMSWSRRSCRETRRTASSEKPQAEVDPSARLLLY